MKKESVIPFMRKVMSERRSAVFKPQWFPADDNSDDTFLALIDLYDEGKIAASGGYLFDIITIC